MAYVLILRGAPRSGKSTYARKIKTAKVFSADSFMVDEYGRYKFDPKRLAECHAKCFANFKCELMRAVESNDTNILVVDNTNIKIWEFQKYIDLCDELQVRFSVMWMENEFGENGHFVPADKIRKMRDSIEPWPGEISYRNHYKVELDESLKYFQKMQQREKFEREIEQTKMCGNCRHFERYEQYLSVGDCFCPDIPANKEVAGTREKPCWPTRSYHGNDCGFFESKFQVKYEKDAAG